MILVERHVINNKHSFFYECDNICFKSKNIYNQGLYNVKQYYFDNKKFLSLKDNYQIIKNQDSYKELPRKVSNQTIKLIDKNFKSFFSLLKNKTIINKIPHYLNKTTGRYVAIFEKQALGLKEFKKTGRIHLSQSNIKIKTKIIDFKIIKEVRIVPRGDYYVIEVVYEKECKKNNDIKISAIDPGLNNLATITFNTGSQPYVINGKPLKSINQYYNKQRAKLQSILEKQYNRKTSKNLRKLTNKRNNKINDFLHKTSRILVNQLVSEQVGTLVLGKNVGQKQDSNIGKVNNQNFVSIPTFRFLDMVKYKSELEGINVMWQEESYTSKASFLNLDYIPVYGKDNQYEFNGRRISRGLYKTKEGILINADVNGSYNILRKAIPNVFTNGIEDVAVHPIRLN